MTTSSKIYKAIKFFVQQEGRCYYCKTLLWNGGHEVMYCNLDHKQPTSRGGRNDSENLCLSCIPCNVEKGNMTEQEYALFKALELEGKMTKKDIPEYIRYLTLHKKFQELGVNTPSGPVAEPDIFEFPTLKKKPEKNHVWKEDGRVVELIKLK